MLLSKTLNKIYRTTLFMFLILTVFTLTNQSKENILRTNVEIKNIEEIPKTEIYLQSNNNYLVKTNIYVDKNTIEEKAKRIIEFLKEDNNKIPIGLQGYLPSDLKINSLILENNNLKINFSKEFNKSNNELVITGLIYSLTELQEIETIEILVDNEHLDNYNKLLSKDVGINKEYILNSRSDINKVTVYYYDEVNNIEYLTPVTKYVNDNREKIEIIISELSKNVPNNLVSYLSEKTSLLDYNEENEVMVLNFNQNFKGKDNEINDKIMKLISESIFENYDVNMILFQENSEKIEYIKRKQ